jgi:type IV secretory pathway VirB2 component (pilin)
MRRLSIAALMGLAAAAAAPAAWASTTSGLAIDTWLHAALTSFVGPVAYAAVLVGMVVAGARLMSGGDLYGFLRTLMMLTVIAGLTLGGQTIIGMMSANAAVVAPSEASSANPTPFFQLERST